MKTLGKGDKRLHDSKALTRQNPIAGHIVPPTPEVGEYGGRIVYAKLPLTSQNKTYHIQKSKSWQGF